MARVREILIGVVIAAAWTILVWSIIAIEARGQSIIAIIPAGAKIHPGTVTQYRCFYSGSGYVVWSIAPAVGAISPSGLYTAPASIPSPATLTVTCGVGSSSSSTSAFLQAPVAPSGPSWIYQEIPVGGYNTPKSYGTGYVLTLKCAIASPSSIHMWQGGLLYYRGEHYYAGAYDPGGQLSNLGTNQIAALNFSCDEGPSPRFRVDYQYVPDSSGNCP